MIALITGQEVSDIVHQNTRCCQTDYTAIAEVLNRRFGLIVDATVHPEGVSFKSEAKL